MSVLFHVHLQTNKQRHNNTQHSNTVLDTVCSLCSGGFKLWSCKHTYESKGQRLHLAYAAPQNESPAYYVPILIGWPTSGDSLTLYQHTSLLCVTTSCKVTSIVQVALSHEPNSLTLNKEARVLVETSEWITTLPFVITPLCIYHRSYKIFHGTTYWK